MCLSLFLSLSFSLKIVKLFKFATRFFSVSSQKYGNRELSVLRPTRSQARTLSPRFLYRTFFFFRKENPGFPFRIDQNALTKGGNPILVITAVLGFHKTC